MTSMPLDLEIASRRTATAASGGDVDAARSRRSGFSLGSLCERAV
jgi:hypothetical protein